VTGLRGTKSVLYWRCQPFKHRCLGCPKRDIVASHIDIGAYSTFDWGHKAVVCMHIDMAQMDMVMEVSMQAQ
jgi:hypothetical protein